MKTDDIVVHVGVTVLVLVLWGIIAFFTSVSTSAIIIVVLGVLFLSEYRYEGGTYKRRKKLNETADSYQAMQSVDNVGIETNTTGGLHFTSTNHAAETSAESPVHYIGEDGHTYKRIREYELRGLSYRGAEANAFVDSLRYKTREELEDVKLYLLRELDNAYDQWAVKVLNSEGLHIGYVQRDVSEHLSELIAEGKYLEARFVVITYSEIKIMIFHFHSDGNDDDDDESVELMDYDRIAELEQKYLEKLRIKADLEQQRIKKKRAEARRVERMRKQEYVGYELEAENKIDEAIVVLSKLIDQGIESHSAHHRLCIMLRKTKCYEDELWVAEKWLELAERQRKENIDVATKIIKVKRRITKIHALMRGD